MLTPDTARAIARRFLKRHPHADLQITAIRQHGDCYAASYESRLFIETDSMHHLVGDGPVVIEPDGTCFPFLIENHRPNEIDAWQALRAENQRRQYAGQPALMTDTTAHALSREAGLWVLKNVGWSQFTRLSSTDRACRERQRQPTSEPLQQQDVRISGKQALEGTAPQQGLTVQVFYDKVAIHTGDVVRITQAGRWAEIPGGAAYRIKNPNTDDVRLLMLS